MLSALNSAGELGWHIPALFGSRPPCIWKVCGNFWRRLSLKNIASNSVQTQPKSFLSFFQVGKGLGFRSTGEKP